MALSSCALTTDYNLDCRDSVGGVKSIYLIELANVTGVTVSAGVASAIAKANNKVFRKYNLVKATADAVEDFQASEENGTFFYDQAINIILNKMQAASRNEIVLLAQNLLMAVVEDRNGKYWLYGKTNGLTLTSGKAGTGKAMGDRNGYELGFKGMEEVMAAEVSSSIIAGLIVA